MDISNEHLTIEDIPQKFNSDFWNMTWREFALSFDGYTYIGGKEPMTNLLNLYQPVVQHFVKTKILPPDLTLSEIRACLFMAQRLWRGSGEGDLDKVDKAYIISLIEAIRDKVDKKHVTNSIDLFKYTD